MSAYEVFLPDFDTLGWNHSFGKHTNSAFRQNEGRLKRENRRDYRLIDSESKEGRKRGRVGRPVSVSGESSEKRLVLRE